MNPAPKPKKPSKTAKKRKRFEEAFGGAKYHAYLTSLPCDICGVVGFTVAAHLTARGAGGKADVTAPLCRTRAGLSCVGTGWWEEGCHERYDAHDPEVRKHEPRLRELARERWASHKQEERVAV